MITKTTACRLLCSIKTLHPRNLGRFLFYAIVAWGLGGTLPAGAGMGENEATIGVTFASQDNTIVVACVLGGACADPQSNVLFRLLSADLASQVFRGGTTVEFDKIINGIGFGSFMSVASGPADTFCWSGVRRTNPGGRSSQGVRDCLRIFRGSGSLSGGTVVTVRSDAAQCAAVAAQFDRPPANGFDYLVRLDLQSYGRQNSVQVVACSGVVAQLATDVVQNGVAVTASRSVSGFDCTLKIGGVCYKR